MVRVLSAESRAVPVPIHASLSREYGDFLNRNTFRFLAGCRPVAQSSLGRTPHPFDVITVVRVLSAESREVPVPNHESLSRNMETFLTGTPFASWRGVSPSHNRRWGERTHPFRRNATNGTPKTICLHIKQNHYVLLRNAGYNSVHTYTCTHISSGCYCLPDIGEPFADTSSRWTAFHLDRCDGPYKMPERFVFLGRNISRAHW